MGAISQSTSAFSWMTSFDCWFEFHFFQGPIHNNCICSDDGVVPNCRQAITWTNADPIHIKNSALMNYLV